jgi:hypothetical protein
MSPPAHIIINKSPGARLTAAAGAKEHCNNAHFSAAVGSRQV